MEPELSLVIPNESNNVKENVSKTKKKGNSCNKRYGKSNSRRSVKKPLKFR